MIIDLEPISRRIDTKISKKKRIYDYLTKINIQIRSLCGGSGTCAKCRILVQKGNQYLTPPSQNEIKLLNKQELEQGWRLACQTFINEQLIDNLESSSQPQIIIFLPDELLLEDFNILTSGINKGVEFNPVIKKLYLEIEKPTLEKPIPDLERIKSSVLKVNKEITFNFELLKIIPKILRESDHKITLTFWNDHKVIAFEPGNTVKDNFGIAFDIGTTTIVGYLINLNDGKVYSTASMLNPQTAYGEDVITRITYIKDNEDGLKKLNSIVIEALNEIILKNCARAKIQSNQIYEATIVGNSVMHHISLGLNPTNIGLSPYIPIVQHGLNVKSKEINLNISQQGNVYILPIIAGFVGADTMGVILSSHIDEEKELTLIIDIGTNGEIILGNKKILATGSCAAGSALEGAHINDGMRAAAGAIDSIKIDPKDLSVSYTTIKDKKAIGICGSGLIDAVSEMLKSKILTRSGSFNKEFINHERIIKRDKNTEFIIARKDEDDLIKDIKITQKDIREIQMAKGAFYSGTKVILKYLNINPEIKQIFLAGAFGNYINKENAKFIGMIPDIPSEKIFQIGNAAGIGAQNCLLNNELRNKAEKLLKNIKYIEIATKKEFQKEFAEAMYFPHLNLDYFASLKEYTDIPKR
ncbi:MAG: DUF4445 domain-containing protein [Promethearchaeota archaeon]|nr:MAG: DUF4445 domain-containing protein [Candidatus Lokiarchaeota archaeon]